MPTPLPAGIGAAPDQEAVRLFQFPQLALVREPGRAVAPSASEEGCRPGLLDPARRADNSIGQYEGTIDQPFPSRLSRRHAEERGRNEVGDDCPDHCAQDREDDQSPDQNRRDHRELDHLE